MIITKRKEGFTILEVLIVCLIIAILAASIPAYIGIQNRARKAAITRAGTASVAELMAWMNSVRKGGPNSPQRLITEVDIDGSGMVEDTERNLVLATNGVANQYVASQTAIGLLSPWDSAKPLWVVGAEAVDQKDCNGQAAANTGQLTLCFKGGQRTGVRALYLSGTDGKDVVFFQKTIN